MTTTCMLLFSPHEPDKAERKGYPRASIVLSNFYLFETKVIATLPTWLTPEGWPEEHHRFPTRSGKKIVMAFKAALFSDFKSFNAIMATEDPDTCKKIGKNVYPFCQAMWDKYVVRLAMDAVFQKFSLALDHIQ